MNKILNKLFLLIAIAVVIPVFTSCSDNNGDTSSDYAQGIVGTYNGYMTGTVGGTLPIDKISDVNITVAYVSENNATLTLNETISTAVGDIPLNVTCPVTTSGKDGKTQIVGKATATFENPIYIMDQKLTELSITVDGMIDSTGAAEINIKDATTGGFMVTVTFNGNANSNYDYAQGIVGTYNGDMTGSAGGMAIDKISDVNITVAYVSENAATLTLNETIPTVVGDIPLNVTCPVATSVKDGKTQIAGNVTANFENPIDIMGAPISALPITVDGTIDSTGVAVINIKDAATGGFMVTVTFNGTLVAAK